MWHDNEKCAVLIAPSSGPPSPLSDNARTSRKRRSSTHARRYAPIGTRPASRNMTSELGPRPGPPCQNEGRGGHIAATSAKTAARPLSDGAEAARIERLAV